jgi:hypothetical protein
MLRFWRLPSRVHPAISLDTSKSNAHSRALGRAWQLLRSLMESHRVKLPIDFRNQQIWIHPHVLQLNLSQV